MDHAHTVTTTHTTKLNTVLETAQTALMFQRARSNCEIDTACVQLNPAVE